MEEKLLADSNLLRVPLDQQSIPPLAKTRWVAQILLWLKYSFRDLIERRPGQISALDGLRALAITFVILGQSKYNFVYFQGVPQPAWLFDTINYGWTGVDLFFVLSGFLIGKMLFEEWKKTGTVKVGTFLLRRGLRIWPLYYFVCLVSLTRMFFSGSGLSLSKYIPDLLFLTDYRPELLAYGSWSLSVEEQFYLIASGLMLLLGARIKKPFAHIAGFLGVLFVAAPLSRLLTWNVLSKNATDLFYVEWEQIHNFLHTHYDGLAVGLGLAAVTVFTGKGSKESKLISPLFCSGLVITAALAYFNHIGFLYSFIGLLYGLAVWSCLRNPDNFFSKALSWRGFQVISRLSFGMYLWYRFPIWKIAQAVVSHFPQLLPTVQLALIFVVTFGVAAVVAAGTYILIERPFLQYRAHLLRIGHSK